MSAWRRKAIKAFPHLRHELNDGREISSVYALWIVLLPLIRDAHRDSNNDLLTSAYGFAEWCRQQGGELSNAVDVSFYEHLFDERWMRPLVVPWLTRSIVEDVRSLWEWRLSSDDLREVDDLLRTAQLVP